MGYFPPSDARIQKKEWPIKNVGRKVENKGVDKRLA